MVAITSSGGREVVFRVVDIATYVGGSFGVVGISSSRGGSFQSDLYSFF